MQIIVMPAWIAGIQVRKDASGNIHVNLDSSTPCWNDAIEGVLRKLTEALHRYFQRRPIMTRAKTPAVISTKGRNFLRSLAFAKLCENSVLGSTGLTTNGYQTLQIKHLAVRPELSRRAPNEFSHSLSVEMTKNLSLRLGVLFNLARE